MSIFGIGFILFSRIEGPVAFFATFFMMALGSSLGGYLPISVALVACGISGWPHFQQYAAPRLCGAPQERHEPVTPPSAAASKRSTSPSSASRSCRAAARRTRTSRRTWSRIAIS